MHVSGTAADILEILYLNITMANWRLIFVKKKNVKKYNQNKTILSNSKVILSNLNSKIRLL